MIIVRSPLRITFGGGGTDLPSYYQEYGGFAIAASIDKYVYITIHETFVDDLIIKYSKLERVPTSYEVEHPIFRETLKLLGIDGKSLEISSMADIPAGTGLGSSSSFTTALLKALHTYQKNSTNPHQLAEQACEIEIDILKEDIGKQDQYAASFGGISCLDFHSNGLVDVQPLKITQETFNTIEENLLLFFTGYIRSASKVMQSQRNQDIEADLHELKDIAHQTESALQHADLKNFALLLSAQWKHKRKRSDIISNAQIDNWYALGMRNGAQGGKLVGAGGGGFLLFYTEDRISLRRAMTMAGLREVRFQFDLDGTKVVT